MRVDLIIINFHSASSALNAIRSVRHELYPILNRVIVVDNGCGEADAFAGKGCEILAFESNRGFAAAVNIAMERVARPREGQVAADMVLLLNPDAWLESGPWLAAFGAVSPDVAALGPAIVCPSGLLQSSIYAEPRSSRVLMESLGVQRWARILGIRRVMPETRTEVDAIQGSCFVIARRAWDAVGPFDDAFFLYHEEVDWCLRARDAGFAVLYEPAVRAVHEGGLDVPAGRELIYYRGVLRLIAKRRGEAAATRLKRYLRRTARVGALFAGDAERARGLRKMADAL